MTLDAGSPSGPNPGRLAAYRPQRGRYDELADEQGHPREGWHRLLPLYTFDTASGLWRHREAPARPPLRLTGLVDDTVRTGARESFDRHLWVGEQALESYLAEGEALLRELPEPSLGGSLWGLVPDDFERLRWFELPAECLPAS